MKNKPMISFIIITNGQKKDITTNCIYRIISSVKNKIQYEIIISGDTENFKHIPGLKFNHMPELAKNGNLSAMRNLGAELATYDILFFMDDDILIDINWCDTFLEYYNKNKFDVYSFRFLLPNGDRYWDRAVCFSGYQTMVSYSHDKYDKNLYQTGGLLVIRKDVFLDIKFDESLLYYKSKEGEININEDVDFSRRLYSKGYVIDFDSNSSATHIDYTTIQFKNNIYKIDDYYNEALFDREATISRYEQIYSLYKHLLKRDPDNEGFSSYLFGNLSIEDIERDIINSNEYRML